MAKILEASCQASIVTVEGVPVEATVLSEGIGSSEGIAVIDADKVTYLTSSAADLKQAIDKIASTLNTVGDTLTAIGSFMTGPTTAPPPTLISNVALITAAVGELNTLKAMLK